MKKIGKYELRAQIGSTKIRQAISVLDSDDSFVVKQHLKATALLSPQSWNEINEAIVVHKKRVGLHANLEVYCETILTTKNVYVVYSHAGSRTLAEIAEYQLSAPTEKRLPEGHVAGVFRQMVAAVVHLHGKGIVHTSIALDHFCFDENGRVTLVCMDHLQEIDAATGTILRPSSKTTHEVYLPPEYHEATSERLTEPYAIDVWSLGVVLYAILHGNLPFESWRGVYQSDPALRQFLSYDCKELILGMLSADVKDRLSLAQVRNHAWFQTFDGQPQNGLDWWTLRDGDTEESPPQEDLWPDDVLSVIHQGESPAAGHLLVDEKHDIQVDKPEMYLYQRKPPPESEKKRLSTVGGHKKKPTPSSPGLLGELAPGVSPRPSLNVAASTLGWSKFHPTSMSPTMGHSKSRPGSAILATSSSPQMLLTLPTVGGTVFSIDGRCVYCGNKEQAQEEIGRLAIEDRARPAASGEYPYPNVGVFRLEKFERPPIEKWNPYDT